MEILTLTMNNLRPYLRNYYYGDEFYVRNEVPGKCNFFEQEYTCELKDGDKIIQYELSQFVYLFMNNFEMSISLNNDISNVLYKLGELSSIYTSDSINEVFKNYPISLSVIKEESLLNYTDIKFGGSCLYKKGIFPSKSFFFDNYEQDWAKSLRTVADNLLQELADFKVDFSKLKQIEQTTNEYNIPKWLKVAIAVGGVVLIKCAVKSFASNADIDFDIPSFDGDSDITTIDIETGEICPSDNNDLNGYNISFGSKNCPPNPSADGYIYHSEVKYDDYKVYKKNGKWWIWTEKDVWKDITKFITK